MPIFLFMAAGAMLCGGGYLLDEAKREAARSEAAKAKRHEGDYLREALRLEDLRGQARARGLDPETVLEGAARLKTGSLAIDDVITFLDRSE